MLVDLDASNIETLASCGISNPAHEGRRRKNCWVVSSWEKGVRAKALVTPDKRACGYIE